jgi:iron(III) transport system permease protein
LRRNPVAAALRDPWTFIGLAGIGFALVFAVVPLLALFAQSLQGQDCDCIGLENFETFFGSRYFRRALFNSLNVATAATILSLAIGVPLAILFTRFRFPGRPVLMTMIVMCMLSPPFIGAYAWVILFGRGGMVTLFARDTLGIELPTIYGPAGISIASAFSHYPVVFFVVSGALQRIDRSFEEAAASLGRRPAMVVATVTLPLALPGVATSALLVFLSTLADFGTANILGEGERYPVLATLAYSLYLNEIGSEPGMAATTSVVLVTIALGLVLLMRLASDRRSVVGDAAAQQPPPARLSGWRAAACASATFLVVAAASLPLVVVCVSSFLDARGAVFQAEFTLENYQKAFALIGDALWNSVAYATAALFAIVVMGSAFGYYVSRYGGPLSRTLDLVAMIPFVVPGTVLGIGYASVFNGPPIYITGTAWIIVIVYIVRRMPYLTRAASSVVYQIDRGLEEASLNLGAPPLAGFRRIMVPLMRPGIMAGMTIAWLEVFNELSASIVLYTGATRTLPIAAYQQAFNGDIGIAAAYATMLVGITAATLAAVIRLGGAEQTLAIK